MNSAVAINLEQAIVDYLTPLCLFAASVTGSSDPLHADEDQYGILGGYIPVPAVVVRVGSGSQLFPDNPALSFPVSVTVRSSNLRSLVSTHNTNATTVADALWDKLALGEAVTDSDAVLYAGHAHDGQEFTRSGRLMETTFTFTIEASSKD